MTMKLLKAICCGFAALGAIVILSCAGLVAYFIIAAPKSPIVDDSDLRIVEPPIPDEENAYLAFMAVTNHFECPSKDERICFSYLNNKSGKFTEFPEIDRILREHESAIPALARIVRMRAYRLVPTSDELGAHFPPISAMSKMNNLCRVKALRSVELGDYDTAFRITCDLHDFFSRCAENASTLAEFLVGIIAREKACETFAVLANAEGINDEMLEKISERLELEFNESVLFAQAVKCEYQNFTSKCLETLEQSGGEFHEFQELKPLCTLCIVPIIRKFAFNPNMTRQLVVNVFRDELSGKHSQEEIPTNINIFQPNWKGYCAIRALMPAFDPFRNAIKRHHLAVSEARTAVAAIRNARAKKTSPL